MNINQKNAVLVSIAVIAAALILGGFFYQAQKPQNSIKVVGIATKSFTADTIKWTISLEETAKPDNLKEGYARLNRQIELLNAELDNRGINTDSLNKKPINVFEQYDYQDTQGIKERIFTGYRLQQNIYIISNKVSEIEGLAFNPITLLDQGIVIRNSNLAYYSSKIDELKKEIIADAAANAKERAMKMLQNTDVKLGKMLSIDSGVFQITEPYSTMVSSSGIYDTSTKNKQIRVTVHAVFAIK